jgi:hypothetical protein
MDSLPILINRRPSGLVDALCSRITKTLESFWQKSEFPDEEFHIPYVHAQYLPVSKTSDEERDKTKDYPFVQVICASGILSSFDPAVNGSEITIQIYFGGYSPDSDNQGWRIPEAMLWCVLQDLCGDKICGGYLFETPAKWMTLNSEDPPYYTAMMETKWKGAPPAIETPFEGVTALGTEGEENFETR